MDKKLSIIPHEVDEVTTVDHLDSRDIQERIDWLEYVINNNPDEQAEKVIEEYQEEVVDLDDLKKQYIDDYSKESWGYGAQFHRADDFENYAQELANDIGAIDEKQSWPNMYIDWERAAEALAQDYTDITFKGVDYYTQEA